MPESLKFHFTPADRPEDETPNPLAKATTFVPEDIEALKRTFGESVIDVSSYAGEQTVRVTPDRLLEVCRFLKQDLGFNMLSDLGGIDRFTEEDRFEVMYNLVSLEEKKRIRIAVRVGEDNPEVDSVSEIWGAADWNERECWDMFGIRFKGHPDLRRMYMPEDFDYHPLRKEFPTLGIPGSLPIPSFESDGQVVSDPYAAARRAKPDE
jgi:NADH-quinone oxidoreductase subunit C